MAILLWCGLRPEVYYPCWPSLLLAGSRLGWPKAPFLLYSASTVLCNFSEDVSGLFVLFCFFPRQMKLHGPFLPFFLEAKTCTREGVRSRESHFSAPQRKVLTQRGALGLRAQLPSRWPLHVHINHAASCVSGRT